MNRLIYAMCRFSRHVRWIPFRVSHAFGSYPPCWRIWPHRISDPTLDNPRATSHCPGQACLCAWWIQRMSGRPLLFAVCWRVFRHAGIIPLCRRSSGWPRVGANHCFCGAYSTLRTGPRLIFTLCWRLFHHARWIPTWRPFGYRCLCARHFYFPRRKDAQ